MKFHESGLPKDAVVEKAFNYSRADMLGREKEELKNFKEHIDNMYEQNLMMLTAEKEDGGMSDAEFNEQKKQLDRMRDAQMAAGPEIITRQLTALFVQHRVALAKELADAAGNASPDLLAAALLSDCVRSPIDGHKLEKEFGRGIAGVVFELAHIDAYPSEREDLLKAAGNDVKRIFLGKVITSIAGTTKQIEAMIKRAPGNKAVLNPGQEESLYEDVKPALGVDKKLDLRIVDTFNKLTDVVQSPFKLEANADGAIELVKGIVNNSAKPTTPVKKPKGPNNGGGNGGIGGGVF